MKDAMLSYCPGTEISECYFLFILLVKAIIGCAQVHKERMPTPPVDKNRDTYVKVVAESFVVFCEGLLPHQSSYLSLSQPHTNQPNPSPLPRFCVYSYLGLFLSPCRGTT